MAVAERSGSSSDRSRVLFAVWLTASGARSVDDLTESECFADMDTPRTELRGGDGIASIRIDRGLRGVPTKWTY